MAFFHEFNWTEQEDVLQALAFSANILNDRIVPLKKLPNEIPFRRK
jgi:hypothetical protein